MEDTHRGKPDPEVFVLAAQRLRAQPEQCWVIEDAPAGVQAARAGGMRCVGVTFVGHHLPGTLKQRGPTFVVSSLEEVAWRFDNDKIAFNPVS